MKLIYEPSVFLISRLEIGPGLQIFLDNEGLHFPMGYNSINEGESDSSLIPEVAGRLCYLSFNNPRPGGNAAYLKHILESGHGSVLEHAVFGMIFTGVSRSLTHELVRHRAGFGFSQLSQRYVDESDVAFVVPPELQNEVRDGEGFVDLHKCEAGELLKLIYSPPTAYSWSGLSDGIKVGLEWIALCETDLSKYVRLTDYLFEKIKKEMEVYNTKDVPDINRELRKRARQTARSVLPNCTETKIFVTSNVRGWRNFIEQRGSRHAEAEIRQLTYRVWEVLKSEAINLFGDYVWTMQEENGVGRPVDVTTLYRKV